MTPCEPHENGESKGSEGISCGWRHVFSLVSPCRKASFSLKVRRLSEKGFRKRRRWSTLPSGSESKRRRRKAEEKASFRAVTGVPRSFGRVEHPLEAQSTQPFRRRSSDVRALMSLRFSSWHRVSGRLALMSSPRASCGQRSGLKLHLLRSCGENTTEFIVGLVLVVLAVRLRKKSQHFLPRRLQPGSSSANSLLG